MNINDYKDGNGNVEVSETLVSDLIDGINENEPEAWKNLPLLNGWVVQGSYVPRYYKRGERVYVEGYIQSGTNITFAQIPVGYRPSQTRYIPGASANGNVNVYNDGTMSFSAIITSNYFQFSYRLT